MSLTNILDDLHKNGCPIKRETLNRYIKILEEAKIIYPCYRFDPKSRKSISGEQKYYLADLGFYFAFNTDKRINYGPALENIVYIYAKSKGYEISVGRIGKLECDFILSKDNFDYAYVLGLHIVLHVRYRIFPVNEYMSSTLRAYSYPLPSVQQGTHNKSHFPLASHTHPHCNCQRMPV